MNRDFGQFLNSQETNKKLNVKSLSVVFNKIYASFYKN